MTVLERQNARHLTARHITEPVGVVVCDASFTRLQTVLPGPLGFAICGAYLVALIKPQFEVHKSVLEKGGIVRDPAQHQDVCLALSTGCQAYLDGPLSGLRRVQLRERGVILNF